MSAEFTGVHTKFVFEYPIKKRKVIMLDKLVYISRFEL